MRCTMVTMVEIIEKMMTGMTRSTLLKLMLLIAPALHPTIAAQTPNRATGAGQDGKLDTAAIEAAIGKQGQMQAGDVFKITLPRADLPVTVAGMKIRPGLALGSWMAFIAAGASAIAHGDLVLTEGEVNPVIAALQRGGFEITGVHNHLLHETPRVMYVHFFGHGEGGQLARTLKDALNATKTPVTTAAASADQPGFDAEKIQQVLG